MTLAAGYVERSTGRRTAMLRVAHRVDLDDLARAIVYAADMEMRSIEEVTAGGAEGALRSLLSERGREGLAYLGDDVENWDERLALAQDRARVLFPTFITR